MQSWAVILGAIAFCLTLALCNDALGQTKVCDPDDQAKCSQPIQKGEAAPFAGQLLTPKLAIDQATRAHDCGKVVEIEVGEAREKLQLRLDAEQSFRALDSRTASMREELLQKRLVEAQEAAVRRWYDDPRVWFVFGVVAGAALTVGAVYGGVEIVKANQ